MEKIFKTLTLLALLIVLTPFLVSAQEQIPNCCTIGITITLDGTEYIKGRTVGAEDICNLTGNPPQHTAKEWGLICLLSTIYIVTDWIFTFLIAFVGGMIIMGAFTLATAAGSPDKVSRGKNYILFAAIGMMAGLLSKAIPSLVQALLG